MANAPINKIISRYYSILSKEDIEKLRNSIFDPQISFEERLSIYRRNQSKIEALEPIFHELIIERNKIASENGYENYFDFIAQWDGLDVTSINEFITKYKTVALTLLNKIKDLTDQNDNFWQTFSFKSTSITGAKTYQIPHGVLDLIPNIDKELLSKIRYESTSEERNMSTDYDSIKKTVTIHANLGSCDVKSFLTFAHEIGHAQHYLSLLRNNIDISTVSNFAEETAAIEFELDIERKLPMNVKILSRDRVLYHFFKTLFEYSVYRDSKHNLVNSYHEAYLTIYNEELPKNTKMYLLDTNFIDWPCYSTLYSVCYFNGIKEEEVKS